MHAGAKWSHQVGVCVHVSNAKSVAVGWESEICFSL